MLAKAVGQSPSPVQIHRFREQAQLLQVFRPYTNPKHPTNPCGSELAREGGGSGNIFGTDTPLSRAGSLLQGFAPSTNLRAPHKSPWELACWRLLWVRQHLRYRHSAFASRLTPTGFCVVHKLANTPQILVGAELARDCGGSGNIFGTEIPPSRASSAPTVWCCLFDHFDKRLHPRTAFVLACQQQQRRYGTWLG